MSYGQDYQIGGKNYSSVTPAQKRALKQRLRRRRRQEERADPENARTKNRYYYHY